MKTIQITDKLFGQQERLSKSRSTTRAASGPTPTNADTTGLFQDSPPLSSQRGSYSSLRARGKPWNQRGVAKFGGGGESLTARNQNAEPKMGDSEKECVQNVKSSLALFKSLGFVVHPTKSVLIPSHKITYLGFEADSRSMTVIPNLEKKRKKTDNTEYSLQIADRELVYCN